MLDPDGAAGHGCRSAGSQCNKARTMTPMRRGGKACFGQADVPARADHRLFASVHLDHSQAVELSGTSHRASARARRGLTTDTRIQGLTPAIKMMARRRNPTRRETPGPAFPPACGCRYVIGRRARRPVMVHPRHPRRNRSRTRSDRGKSGTDHGNGMAGRRHSNKRTMASVA